MVVFIANRRWGAALQVLLCLWLPVASQSETGDYIHYRLAVKYKSDKKYDAAIDEFRKVLATYPDNYNAYMHIAEIRMAEDKPRLVIYNLKKALTYNPGWGKAHKMLSKAYEKDGQFQKAIIELQQYQQYSDPEERDSLQSQIERLIRHVSGEVVPDGKTAEAAVQSDTDASAVPVDTTNDISKNVNPEVKSTAESGSERPKTETSVKTTDSKQSSLSENTLFIQAVAAYNDGHLDNATELLRQVLQKRPGHAGAYYYAGLIRTKKGQTKMAKVNFMRAITFPELGHNAHFYLGKIFAEEKNFTEAIRQLNFYIAKTSYEIGKKEALALIETYKKALSPAQLESVMKIEANPMAPQTLVPELPVVIPTEKYSQIEIRIDSLLSMLTVDTLSDLGRQLLAGIIAFKNGMYDESIKAFREVLALKPGGAAAMHCLYNTGICYFRLGLYKEAENQFQQVIDRFSGQPVAAQSLFLKAMTYMNRDEPGVAEKLFRKFIQEYRHHSWSGKAFEMLGDAYVDLEQHKKAIDSYIQAAAKESAGYVDRVFAQFKLGTTYAQINNQTRAIQAYKTAIELGEKHNVYVRIPDSYYRIADEQYKLKEYKGALDYYTRVTRKYPSYQETPWGLFQIGSIHKNLKEYNSAVKVFKDLIKRYPEDYWAKQAQWKLEDSIWENEYKSVLQ